jgi:hypothetical protein
VIIEPKYIQTSELDITYPTPTITLHTTPAYKNTPINATTAAPPDTPFTTDPPVNAGAVGVELAPALLTALPTALVALGTYLLCVAATLATLAADADAAGLRGLAALQ